jgi:hypothetical protein
VESYLRSRASWLLHGENLSTESTELVLFLWMHHFLDPERTQRPSLGRLKTLVQEALESPEPDALEALPAFIPCDRSLNPRPVEWVWKDYIAVGSITALIGSPKCGKTTLLHEVLRIGGTGGGSLGTPIAPLRCIWISEEADSVWAGHLEAGATGPWAMRNTNTRRLSSRAEWQAYLTETLLWCLPGTSPETPAPLVGFEKAPQSPQEERDDSGVQPHSPNPENPAEEAAASPERLPGDGEEVDSPVVVVLDTFAHFAPLESENENAEVTALLGDVQDTFCFPGSRIAVVLLHHTRKGTSDVHRGASALPAEVTTILALTEVKGKDHRRRNLVCMGSRHRDWPQDPLKLRFDDDGRSWSVVRKDRQGQASERAVHEQVARDQGVHTAVLDHLEKLLVQGDKHTQNDLMALVERAGGIQVSRKRFYRALRSPRGRAMLLCLDGDWACGEPSVYDYQGPCPSGVLRGMTGE